MGVCPRSDMSETSIPCSERVRDELRKLKRGGESWDSLLEKMRDEYDPDA